jgi:ribosomal protein L4
MINYKKYMTKNPRHQYFSMKNAQNRAHSKKMARGIAGMRVARQKKQSYSTWAMGGTFAVIVTADLIYKEF